MLSLFDVGAGLLRLEPMRTLRRYAARHNGVAPLITLGGQRIWLVSDPYAIDQILRTGRGAFDKAGPIYNRLAGRGRKGAQGVLDGGLFTENDHTLWLAQRSVLTDYLSARNGAAIATSTLRAVQSRARWWDLDRPVCLLDEFVHVSINVLSSHLFGDAAERGVRSEIGRLAPLYFRRMALRVFVPWLPGARVYRQLAQSIDGLIDRVIQAAKAEPECAEGTLLGDLTKLFDLDSLEGARVVKGFIGTMFLAGFDSSAVVQAQACLHLARDQALQRSLRSELDSCLRGQGLTADAVGQLEKLQAFWQLMLHEHPAFRLIFRNVTEPISLQGHQLRKGDQLLIFLDGLHHLGVWQREGIRLDGFIGTLSPQQRLAHRPYGAGPQKCAGELMANTEGLVTLAWLLQNYEWRRPRPNWGGIRQLSMTGGPVDSRVWFVKRS